MCNRTQPKLPQNPSKPSKLKKFRPAGRFHTMLRYIRDNPGSNRSAWYVDRLGYRPEPLMMGSINSDKSEDGFAYAHQLITIRDEGCKPTTYQMRITARGAAILARLDAGEVVPEIDTMLG